MQINLQNHDNVVQIRHFKEAVCSSYFEARTNLMRELQKTKISMNDLAEIAKVSPQTVSRLKHGETFEPRGKTLIGLYKALNIRLIFE